MRRNGLLVIFGTVLVGLSLLWNTFAAGALPGPDDDSMVRLVENRLNWTSGLIDLGSASPNTPAPPKGIGYPTLRELPPTRAGVGRAPISPSPVAAREIPVEVGALSPDAEKRADLLRHAGVQFELPETGMPTGSSSVSASSTSEEICVNVLRNPELDVVEFGDDTGSIEYWSILYSIVFYTDHTYTSEYYSVSMSDEPEGADTDTDDFWGTGLDYDMFGQGFWTPPNMTRIKVSFSSAYEDWNEGDMAWANLVVLTDEGYVTPDGFEVIVEIPMIAEATWEKWYWDITAEDYPEWMLEMSNRPLAIVYDHLSDRQAPYQRIRLDDLQVEVCYQRGASAVYLPLVRRDPPADPGPRCLPREPDSLENPGFMTVGATCHGSFTALDQRDYYTLDLKGASKVRLCLEDLLPTENWDAMIYENSPHKNYPLVCHLSRQHPERWRDCPMPSYPHDSFQPAEEYFVLVNRGPRADAGQYTLRVQRR